MVSASAPPCATYEPALVDEVLARHHGEAGALLPILHAMQEAFGHVPAEAVPRIARALNLSRAEVHGVVTYYHHFRSTPPVAPVLQICRAEACQAMGSDVLWAHAQTLAGCQAEAVYCLGLCASSPAALWGEQPVARLTVQRLDRLVAEGVPLPRSAR